MTSENLKWYQQTSFVGGIQTETENAKPNQVRDALNFWTPDSQVVRRPGVGARQIMDPQDVPATTAAGATYTQPQFNSGLNAWYKQSAAGTYTALGFTGSDINVGTLNPYESLFVFFSADASIPQVEGYYLPLLVKTLNTNLTNYALEVYTSRGWTGIEVRGPAATFATYNGDVVGGPYYRQKLYFSTPADTIVDYATLIAAGLPVNPTFPQNQVIALRFRITGVATSAGLQLGGSVGLFVQNLALPITYNAGFFLAKYAAGTKTIGITANPSSTELGSAPTYTQLGKVPPYISYSERDQLYFESKTALGSTYGNTNYSYLFTTSTLGIPPTFTVVPEFNTAFSAYQNVIVEHPYEKQGAAFGQPPAYGTLTASPYYNLSAVYHGGPNSALTYYMANVAQVSANIAVVGTAAQNSGFLPDYSSDTLSLDASFPAANYIIYFKNRLWCAGIKDQPNSFQWSAPVTDEYGNYSLNVWPSAQQSYLSTAQDNSPITGIAAMGDNLVIFKKNSVWQIIDTGDDPSTPAIATYEARLVVPGVGCVGHGTIQQVSGGLIFLGEDGFYFYDGTPNIRRISDDVKEYIGRINPAREQFATSTFWRTKYHYMCAVSLDAESNSNDWVFAYDIQLQSWWMWSGWDVQCWYQDDGVGQQEDIWFLDRFGRAYKLGWDDTDNGIHIDTMLLTQRFGEHEELVKAAREVRLEGQNNNETVTFDVITDDIATVSGKTLVMPFVGEAKWEENAPILPGTAYVPPRRRERKKPMRSLGRWFQVKIYNSLKIIGIALGYSPESRR